MKPYYQDDHVTLFLGDCLEHPEWWTDADVMVTDPPYGMDYQPRVGAYTGAGSQLNRHLNRIPGDLKPTARDTAIALWGDSPRMVFGTWKVPRPEPVDHRLIWWKRGQAPGPANSAFQIQDEEIYVTGNGWVRSAPPKRSVFATDEMRSLEVQKVGHPTPKPLPLMEWLLERCQPEWTIADPFAGSGSTLVAAKALGRRAVGVELEEKYCEIAARRLAQEVLPIWELDGGGAS